MPNTTFIATVVEVHEKFVKVMSNDVPYKGEILVDYKSEELDFELKEGMIITFETSGAMAMSYPPRTFAHNIKRYIEPITFSAKVKDIGDNILVTNTDKNSPYYKSEILVHTDVNPDNLKIGSSVIIAFSGKMSRSIPPQITALSIEIVKKQR